MKTIYTATVKFEVDAAPLVIESTSTWHFADIDERQKFVETMKRKGFAVKTDVEWEVKASEAEEQALHEIEQLGAFGSRVAA